MGDRKLEQLRSLFREMGSALVCYSGGVDSALVLAVAHEVLGKQRLEDLARVLYAEGEDPSAVTRTEKPYTFGKQNGVYEIRMLLPFATKGEVELFKKGDELVVQIGTFRRHIGLPRSMAALSPSRAKLESKVLTVEMKETP